MKVSVIVLALGFAGSSHAAEVANCGDRTPINCFVTVAQAGLGACTFISGLQRQAIHLDLQAGKAPQEPKINCARELTEGVAPLYKSALKSAGKKAKIADAVKDYYAGFNAAIGDLDADISQPDIVVKARWAEQNQRLAEKAERLKLE